MPRSSRALAPVSYRDPGSSEDDIKVVLPFRDRLARRTLDSSDRSEAEFEPPPTAAKPTAAKPMAAKPTAV